MEATDLTLNHALKSQVGSLNKVRRTTFGYAPDVFTDIFQDEVNIAIWQRQLPAPVHAAAARLLAAQPSLQLANTLTPEEVVTFLQDQISDESLSPLFDNIAELVDMFCFLFDLKRTGLRLTALDRAMCPRFHVDKVPCRLVTTFKGDATQWLEQAKVDRSKLGVGNNGLADDQSGIYTDPKAISTLVNGDVALSLIHISEPTRPY